MYKAQETVQRWSWKYGTYNLEIAFKILTLGRSTSSMADNAPIRLMNPQTTTISCKQNTKNNHTRLCKANQSRQVQEGNWNFEKDIVIDEFPIFMVFSLFKGKEKILSFWPDKIKGQKISVTLNYKWWGHLKAAQLKIKIPELRFQLLPPKK